MSDSIMAIDYGDARVGLAIASVDAKIARPLTTLSNNSSLLDEIANIQARENIKIIVLGLPRSLSGDDTLQTIKVRKFADKLRSLTDEVVLQDEAVTSAQAKSELEGNKKSYSKGDIDALAACYILEDYLGNLR